VLYLKDINLPKPDKWGTSMLIAFLQQVPLPSLPCSTFLYLAACVCCQCVLPVCAANLYCQLLVRQLLVRQLLVRQLLVCHAVLQVLTYNGFYDPNNEWVGLEGVQIVASMNAGGSVGKHDLTSR